MLSRQLGIGFTIFIIIYMNSLKILLLILIITSCAKTTTIILDHEIEIQPAIKFPTTTMLIQDQQAITPKISDTPTATLTETSPTKNIILYAVPFTSQAPFAEWDDPIFQDACEEACFLMAVLWTKDTKEISPQQAQQQIIAISNYQEENYGSYVDTSTQDTLIRIINGYFNYQNATLKTNVTLQNIIDELKKGNIIVAPANGQQLDNPYYTPPGPEYHNLLIIGYNPLTEEFITNDPGTKRGEGYRYNQQILFDAIRDYPTGSHEEILNIEKNIIIIKK